ncbi:unnamed protein product [Rotaria magnacalcarata]|nr:unnamed protein product [Rotaria magnacalcarata]
MDNNGHHSDSGLGPNDRNGDHDEKFSRQMSRATSKEEMNVDLTPKKHKDFSETLSLTSEASSMPIDNEFDDMLNNNDIESLSQELANRGPQLCEKQIRYLYDIFLMADCYDWAFLFSLILKSQTMINQVISAVRIQDLPTQIIALQRGLVELETWADIECPEYKPLLLSVRNQAQALLNQRRASVPSTSQSAPTKKTIQSKQDDELFSLKQTDSSNRPEPSRKKPTPRNRTTSATDPNQSISSFESLSVDTQHTNNNNNNNKSSCDASPTLRARRFSDDIVLPSASFSKTIEPSLFSPGSVRARTISSIQEDKHLPPLLKKQSFVSTTTNDSPPPRSPLKLLDVRLSSGKTVNSSDFIHLSSANHIVNPHAEVSHDQEVEHHQLSNDTARHKLLQSVYVNTENSNTSPLSDSLTNGTNYHTHVSESSSNCVLS